MSHDHTDWQCREPAGPGGEPCTLAAHGPYEHPGPHDWTPIDPAACGCRRCCAELEARGAATGAPPRTIWGPPPADRIDAPAGALTLRASSWRLDWYVVEEDGDSVTDADVAGTAADVLALAAAIEARDAAGAPECAVRVAGSAVDIWCPRNGRRSRRVTLAAAAALAAHIRAVLGSQVRHDPAACDGCAECDGPCDHCGATSDEPHAGDCPEGP